VVTAMRTITNDELDFWERCAREQTRSDQWIHPATVLDYIAEIRRLHAFRDEMHDKVRAIESAMKQQHEQNVEALLERPK
jgi:hypothetical protein